MNHKSILTEDEVKIAILEFQKGKFNYVSKHYDVTVNLEDWTVTMEEKVVEKVDFRTRILSRVFGLWLKLP